MMKNGGRPGANNSLSIREGVRTARETVLKIDIIRVQVFRKRAWNIPVGSVVIQLQFEVGVLGNRVRPTSDHIAAADVNVAIRARLGNPATVIVALQSEEVGFRRVP